MMEHNILCLNFGDFQDFDKNILCLRSIDAERIGKWVWLLAVVSISVVLSSYLAGNGNGNGIGPAYSSGPLHLNYPL